MDFHRIREIIKTEHTLQEDEWKGAVLFLCDEENVYFIKRSDKMPTHGGQIAFVGGHKQAGESDPWEAAQREFEEETAHSRNVTQFIGYLPVVMTARLQPIIPVVAKLLISKEEFFKNVRTNGEWVDIMAYSWEELIIENNWEYAWRNGYSKSPVLFHTMRNGRFLSLTSDFHAHLLWGATASMVWDFLHLYFKPKVGSY
ncbi:MAG TPA: NUDIX domain-containing protein [Bacteriovoracaceae bacterium]|nr:NUDIX domain-containing protein [Bacteriovoracaceae bacterium]